MSGDSIRPPSLPLEQRYVDFMEQCIADPASGSLLHTCGSLAMVGVVSHSILDGGLGSGEVWQEKVPICENPLCDSFADDFAPYGVKIGDPIDSKKHPDIEGFTNNFPNGLNFR